MIPIVVPVHEFGEVPKWKPLANICKASVDKIMPDAVFHVFEYGDLPEINLTAEGKGDYAKALASEGVCEEGRAQIVMDADVLCIHPLDFNPGPEVLLAMYETIHPPGVGDADFSDAILAAMRHAGFETSAGIIVKSWLAWTKVSLAEPWRRWYEFVQGLIGSGAEWDILNRAPGIIVWNLVWYEFHKNSQTEPLPGSHNRLGSKPAFAHAWVIPDRIAGLKGRWLEEFHKEYPEISEEYVP